MATKQYLNLISTFRKRKAQMLAMLASGKSMADVGRKYGISRQRVRQIVNG